MRVAAVCDIHVGWIVEILPRPVDDDRESRSIWLLRRRGYAVVPPLSVSVLSSLRGWS